MSARRKGHAGRYVCAGYTVTPQLPKEHYLNLREFDQGTVHVLGLHDCET
jgi:hypothetical protein